MIDKLVEIDGDFRKYLELNKPDVLMIWDKINEIIEALNRSDHEKDHKGD